MSNSVAERSPIGFPGPRTDSTIVNVLIVEDDEIDARAVQRHLARLYGEKLNLRRSVTLADALSQIESEEPELVISDVGLPDSQGMDTVNQMIAAVPLRPLTVLTGDTDDEKALLRVAAGATDYLVKSEVTFTSLRRSMRHSIERKQSEMRIRHQAELLNRTDEAIVICTP